MYKMLWPYGRELYHIATAMQPRPSLPMPVGNDAHHARIMAPARHLYVRRDALAQALDMAYHADLPLAGNGVETLKGLDCGIEVLAAQGAEPFVDEKHVDPQTGVVHSGEPQRKGKRHEELLAAG